MKFAHPLDPIVAAIPELQPWWAKQRAFGEDDESIYPLLLFELLEHTAGGTIPLLATLAPHLEQLLENEEGDEISLGFIKHLIQEAEERDLDLRALRESLGPVGQATWNNLYLYLHQTRLLTPVYFTPEHLGAAVGNVARMESWDVQATEDASTAGTTLGTIATNGTRYALRAKNRLFVGKRIAAVAAPLAVGDLLLYVLPDDGRRLSVQELVALEAAT